jgi:hypothetical protein
VKNRTSHLNTLIVSLAGDRSVDHEHGANWDATVSHSGFRFLDRSLQEKIRHG